jgi:hypothetical protein
LTLERRYDEAIRLLQIRLTEFHKLSDSERGSDQLSLAFVDPMLDPLQGEPRFEQLVAKVFAPKSASGTQHD